MDHALVILHASKAARASGWVIALIVLWVEGWAINTLASCLRVLGLVLCVCGGVLSLSVACTRLMVAATNSMRAPVQFGWRECLRGPPAVDVKGVRAGAEGATRVPLVVLA